MDEWKNLYVFVMSFHHKEFIQFNIYMFSVFCLCVCSFPNIYVGPPRIAVDHPQCYLGGPLGYLGFSVICSSVQLISENPFSVDSHMSLTVNPSEAN